MTRRTLEPEVILNDGVLLAVLKPAGMPTVTGRGTRVVSCRRWLADKLFAGDLRAVLPIHRIDADTSGLVLFARTPEAQRALSIQFQNRQVEKEYHALVLGGPIADSGVVQIAIGSDRRKLNQSKLDPQHGKPASTEYEVLERFRGYCLVACRPKTGRRHQIRLHMKALGCPLAVDPLYNAPEKPKPTRREWEQPSQTDEEENGVGLYVSDFKRGFKPGKHRTPVIGRLTLHSLRLKFFHPGLQQNLTLTAELPKDFRAALTQLRKWAH